jgi:uncharacterized protein YcbK (DUF882 family)
MSRKARTRKVNSPNISDVEGFKDHTKKTGNYKKESLGDLGRLLKWNHGYDENDLRPSTLWFLLQNAR